MAKKLPLYILLVFLIVVNCFFLYNYLGTGNNVNRKEPIQPKLFLAQELSFNDEQKEQFEILEEKHHKRMHDIANDVRVLKDRMFDGFFDDAFEEENINDLTKIIGEKEAAKDLEIFRHFRQIKALCNAEQKEKFNAILKYALRGGDRARGTQRGRREGGFEENRPPPPINGDQNGPPEGRRTPPPNH